MDAEKSILVAKSPTFPRRKVSNSNAFSDVKRNTHLLDKHVHMTVNGRGVAALRSNPSSGDENLPAPDYPRTNYETSKQIPTKEVILVFVCFKLPSFESNFTQKVKIKI